MYCSLQFDTSFFLFVYNLEVAFKYYNKKIRNCFILLTKCRTFALVNEQSVIFVN